MSSSGNAFPIKPDSKGEAAATATTSVEHKDGSVVETHEHPLVHVGPDVSDALVIYDGPIAHVGVELSYTKNLGNYSSAKFTVNIQVPTNLDAIDKTFEWAKNWVDVRLNEMIK